MKIFFALLHLVTFSLTLVFSGLIMLVSTWLITNILIGIAKAVDLYKKQNLAFLYSIVVSLVCIYLQSFFGAFYSLLASDYFPRTSWLAYLMIVFFMHHSVKGFQTGFNTQMNESFESELNGDLKEAYALRLSSIVYKYPRLIFVSFVIFSLTDWETIFYGDYPAALAKFCKW